MEDDCGDVFRLFYELIDARMKFVGGQVVTMLDVPANIVIVADIDDEIIFAGHLVALDDF